METLIIDKEEFVDLLTKQIAKGHELLSKHPTPILAV